jgi:hypothetical protein
MKKVQFGKTLYLNEYTEYDKTSLHKLFGKLYDQLNKAEESGLKKVYAQFQSTMDPYENAIGPVEVEIRGERELYPHEVRDNLEQKRIQALATKLKVTFYEASVVDRLEKANKVKL